MKKSILTSLISTFTLLTLLFVSQAAIAQEPTSEFPEETTTQDAGTAPEAGTAQIVPAFDTPVPFGHNNIYHANDQFEVQWGAFNAGTAPSVPFTDSLRITHFPEGSIANCLTSSEGQIVYDSQTDATDPSELDEPAIPAGLQGPLMSTNVGPFPDWRSQIGRHIRCGGI